MKEQREDWVISNVWISLGKISQIASQVGKGRQINWILSRKEDQVWHGYLITIESYWNPTLDISLACAKFVIPYGSPGSVICNR